MVRPWQPLRYRELRLWHGKINPSYTNVQIANVITSNASTDDPLLRNGACWPNDGTTFGRLDVLEMLEETYYEACGSVSSKGRIYGYALDAESGLPLAGAKVTALPPAALSTGINYVPYYGETTYFPNDSVLLQGYGLFNVLTLPGNNTLTIQKPKTYVRFSPKDQSGLPVTIPVTVCNGTYAGNIPIPPVKPLYWLAITWNYANWGPSANYYHRLCRRQRRASIANRV